MLPDILDRVAHKGWKVFSRPLSVNLVAVRNPVDSNEFNDTLYCCYTEDSVWVTQSWPCTTDPGRYYLDHPMNKDGTARLVQGQYLGSWRLGRHHDEYPALVQAKPVCVQRIRDGVAVQTSVGMYGINIHRASAVRTSQFVDRWSAGCIVLPSPNDFAQMLRIVEDSMAIYGPTVTLTLLEG